MADDNEPRRKSPWSPLQYLVLVVIVILAAVFVVRPIGLQVAAVFQRLTDAFQNGK